MSVLPVIGAERWYELKKLADGVTLIHEPWIKPFYRCNMWHVQGRDRDLLFDTGLGHFPLRASIAALRERPVICVASHSHFDHIGCHHEFSTRCIHAAEADILANPRNDWTLADRYATDEMFDGVPEGWSAAAYRIKSAPATRILTDGEVIDLGDRVFEVVHTPGHSPGGIALWERKTGTLLSGDIIYDGPLIDDCYHSDLGDYETSLRRLAKLSVETVHGGHFPSFGRARLIEVIDEYLAGRRLPGCHLDT
ncbi:MAG: MBL fold metallo-hydrolase [Rhodospirillaceae bacterium]|jgi:glyoxylase-like metal-dependent hydrolase (beta-lactamase superfamily II)|nr:MBL fold metallo-hydrolase [Rhodospirillaceae bacterium]